MMPMGGESMPPIEQGGDLNAMSDNGLDGNQPQPDMNNIGGSEFDTNFDAGVEADEETDPKKYIQQLTGKLSQTLNSYNNDNGEPDTELGKYVLGMLIKQGTKGMDENDRKEIIKKINTNNSVEPDDDMELSGEDDNADDTFDSENMQNESKIIRCTKKQIFESFGIAMDTESETAEDKVPDTKISNDTKRNRKTRPFEAPKKFKE